MLRSRAVIPMLGAGERSAIPVNSKLRGPRWRLQPNVLERVESRSSRCPVFSTTMPTCGPHTQTIRLLARTYAADDASSFVSKTEGKPIALLEQIFFNQGQQRADQYIHGSRCPCRSEQSVRHAPQTFVRSNAVFEARQYFLLKARQGHGCHCRLPPLSFEKCIPSHTVLDGT